VQRLDLQRRHELVDVQRQRLVDGRDELHVAPRRHKAAEAPARRHLGDGARRDAQRRDEALEDRPVRSDEGLVLAGALDERVQTLEAPPQHALLLVRVLHRPELPQQARNDRERDAEHGQRWRDRVKRRGEAAREATHSRAVDLPREEGLELARAGA
jgi:hypothetical protein